MINNKIIKFGQYKKDIFSKLDYDFKKGLKILDIGCGDGVDSQIFSEVFNLDVYSIDIYEHENISNMDKIKFLNASIYKIPFPDDYFDYVFLHDVLHHIDEEHQSYSNHINALIEVDRVCNNVNGTVIIVEGNRYNPLFYPHMVKHLGHEHWQQSYFFKVINGVFFNAKFSFFEAHFYPWGWVVFWKLYEFIMENVMPKKMIAYNIAIIDKT